MKARFSCVQRFRGVGRNYLLSLEAHSFCPSEKMFCVGGCIKVLKDSTGKLGDACKGNKSKHDSIDTHGINGY